ncbi:MAG: Phosphoglycolate phosphatase [Alphaproteobacteria bacterium ADurb.BinA280]|nr:MAG: Phosphoglycolate phosphatase [Alphaproteobacteria bacterium ADurb.BinA280]
MSQRAVLFDLDGTLVDSAPDLWRAANEVATAILSPGGFAGRACDVGGGIARA